MLQVILDDDTFVETLDHIVQRDFYPDLFAHRQRRLHALQQQYLHTHTHTPLQQESPGMVIIHCDAHIYICVYRFCLFVVLCVCSTVVLCVKNLPIAFIWNALCVCVCVCVDVEMKYEICTYLSSACMYMCMMCMMYVCVCVYVYVYENQHPLKTLLHHPFLPLHTHQHPQSTQQTTHTLPIPTTHTLPITRTHTPLIQMKIHTTYVSDNF